MKDDSRKFAADVNRFRKALGPAVPPTPAEFAAAAAAYAAIPNPGFRKAARHDVGATSLAPAPDLD